MTCEKNVLGMRSILFSMLDVFNGKTILITGGRGFIGSALTQTLATANAKIILLDRSASNAWVPECPNAEIMVMQGDIAAPETWESVLHGVDYVFHLASQDYVREPDADRLFDLQVNALPVQYMLEVCRRHNYFPHIVFASSANLFGVAKSLPVNEDFRDDPLTPWSVHKLMAEGYLRAYAAQYGISSTILRLANVYGPTARQSAMKRVAINSVIARALSGEDLALYANHKCVRDYVFLEDVVRAFLLAGAQLKTNEPRSDLYILGSGEGRTISETWQLIAERVSFLTNKNVGVKLLPFAKLDAFEMRNIVADSTRFQSATGWKPQVEIAQGIDLTIQAFWAIQSQY